MQGFCKDNDNCILLKYAARHITDVVNRNKEIQRFLGVMFFECNVKLVTLKMNEDGDHCSHTTGSK